MEKRVSRLIMAGLLFGIAAHALAQEHATTLVFRSDMIMILEFKAVCDSQVPASKTVNDRALSESRFANMNIPNFQVNPEIGISASMDQMLTDMRKDIHNALEKIPQQELVDSCARFPASLTRIEQKYPAEVLEPYIK